MSSGKKNDHKFYTVYLECTMNLEDDGRMSSNRTKILINIAWTDNCLTQCKHRKKFPHAALQPLRSRNTSVAHRFAEVYHFKVPWDGTGKQLKKFISDCELMRNRCLTGKACYERCRLEFASSLKHPG